MLKLLIILFVIALCVGPILYLAPSLRQKRIAELRRLAAEKGLHLKTVRNPTLGPEHKPTENDSTFVTVYSRKWQDEADFTTFRKALGALEPVLLVREDYEHGAHYLGVWEKRIFPENTALVGSALETLAKSIGLNDADIMGIEINSEGVGVYWNENTNLPDASDSEAKAVRVKKLDMIASQLDAFVNEVKPQLIQIAQADALEHTAAREASEPVA